jgi:hypothetical protein
MGHQLKPGTFSDTVDTMAKAMEAAFLDQWALFNPKLPEPDEKQLNSMRLFFVAVSQGVVQHLRDNADSFDVEVADGSSTLEGTVVQVHTTGTTS